jgi:tetratricopeptide (TPR) repeat protein
LDKATAIKQRAQAHIHRGSFKEAMVEYQKLLALTPVDPYAYILLGDLALRMGKRADAIKRYTEAADGYEQQGFCRNAIAVLKRVLRLDPSQVDQLRRLADLYSREALITEAVTHYLDYGTACLKLKRPDDCRQVLEIVSQLGAQNHKVALRVIALCEALGDKERAALELLRVASELERKGQLVRARELRARAQDIAPGVRLAESSVSLGGYGATLDPKALVEGGEGGKIEPGAELTAALEAAESEDSAAPASKIMSVMPGLERSGTLFAPIDPGRDEPPALLADLELGAPKGGTDSGAAPAALDLGALERAMGGAPTLDHSAPDDPALALPEEEEPVHEYVIDETPPEAALAEAIQEMAAEAEEAPPAEPPAHAGPIDLDMAWQDAEAGNDLAGAFAALSELWQQGRREREVVERLRELARALGNPIAEGRWLAELGELELSDGNWSAARDLYAHAIELDPKQPLAHRRAERLQHLGAESSAGAAAPAAEAMDEAVAEPTVELAAEEATGEDEVLDLGANGDAIREAETGIGVANDADVARLIDHFREAIGTQLSGEDHASHYDLGMTYLEMGLVSEAVGEFQKALGGAQYRRRCLELLATCYSRLGSPEQAAAHWRAALAASQGDGNEIELRYELACCLVAAGHLDEARDELKKVLIKSPEHPDARDRLAALGA